MIDFVERLAWRMSSGSGKELVDAAYLKNKSEEEIGSLQLLSDQFQVFLIKFLVILVAKHFCAFQTSSKSAPK